MPTISTTAVTMNGGVNTVVGQGADTEISFGGVWAVGDTYSIILTDTTTGVQTLIGAGNITNIAATYVFTFNQKLYLLAGPVVYFSEVGNPTSFNSLTGTGNGFVRMSNIYAAPEDLVSASVYQGRLAFFARRTVQIWIVDANPANWQLSQVLQNIGTVAPFSVQPIGDLDVFFLADSGIRSLRARDNTLNAFVNDLGSPVDLLVQAAMGPGPNLVPLGTVYDFQGEYHFPYPDASKIYVVTTGPNELFYSSTPGSSIDFLGTGAGVPVTATIKLVTPFSIVSKACAIVEPTSNRYWLYLNGQVFVFSYFPSGKVVAWSTYSPTYEASVGVPTIFTPSKFTLFQGQVFARANNGTNDLILQYGGPSNVSYDSAICNASMPWLDLGTPSIRKAAKSIDYVISGAWTFLGSMDYQGVVVNGGPLQTITSDDEPSYQGGDTGFAADGFNVQLEAKTTGNTAATLSNLVFHYEIEDENE